MKKLLALVVFLLSFAAVIAHEGDPKPFVVVIASYNNAAFYEKNLSSVFVQNYENYRVIYLNDASTDGTGELVENFVSEQGAGDKVNIVHNPTNMGTLYNTYHAVHSCNDEEIVVLLDGDDWFAHENVLSRLNDEYQNPQVWLTYGHDQTHPSGDEGFSKPFPQQVIRQNNFRGYAWVTSHPMTFYAALFKKIDEADLKEKGKFYAVASDVAFMFPMLEMAGWHIRFIDEVLYIYNCDNPLNDFRIRGSEQHKIGMSMRRKKRYKPLKQLFE